MVNLVIDTVKTTQQIVRFIKSTLSKTGFNSVVVGLSGGIDSAVSFALAVRAIGAQNVYPCLFPYGELNREGKEDAMIILNNFHTPQENVTIIDIKPLVDSITALDPPMDDLRRGNVMVRIRMIL